MGELQTLKGLSLEHQNPLSHNFAYPCLDPVSEPASGETAVLAMLASAAAAGPAHELMKFPCRKLHNRNMRDRFVDT